EDRDQCLAAGMDDFLAKPIQAADLLASIDRVVAGTQTTTPEAPALLDPKVLLAACGGDADLLGKVCQALQTCLPGQLASVRDAVRGQDTPRLREAAHKLGGMVSAFSTVTAAVVSDLEDQAAAGRLDQCRPLVAQLEALAGELLRQVDGLSVEDL